jgi:hypothetical protein
LIPVRVKKMLQNKSLEPRSDSIGTEMALAANYRTAKLIPIENAVAQSKNINWLHVSTLIAVAILVGTEMVGASWAAGWALGGLLQLDPLISHGLEVIFGLCGFVLLFYFMRTALRHETIRG